MLIPDIPVIFIEHITNSYEGRDFHSVKFKDLGGNMRKLNFVGNIEDFENLKCNDSCKITIRLRFGKDNESYVLKSVYVVSIKKI